MSSLKNLARKGLSDGLLPVHHQTITWTKINSLSIRSLGINFIDFFLNQNTMISIPEFAFENVYKMLAIFQAPIC